MLLGLRSDTSVAELMLYDQTGTLVGELSWEADRQLAHGLLKKIDDFLRDHATTLEKLDGLFVFQGPGSFTGLRIGLTVMNTVAYANSLPIVGETGDEWRREAVRRLCMGENDHVVLPFYGAEARITQPKK